MFYCCAECVADAINVYKRFFSRVSSQISPYKSNQIKSKTAYTEMTNGPAVYNKMQAR